MPPSLGRAQKSQQLVVRLVFRNDAVGEVRTVEAGDVTFRLAQFQVRDDILAHARRGGGGERHERDFGKHFPQLRELAVFRAEIVAPFADAMRLVHGDEPHIPARQVIEEAGQHQPFRRGVEQAELAVVQTAQTLAAFARRERGIQERRRNAARLKRVHLVLHQRNERGDNDREAVARERGKLEAKRFAAAGRQQREDVVARQRIADDFLLQWPERGEAEVLLQKQEQIWRIGFQSC
jgi:hypothetical protein